MPRTDSGPYKVGSGTGLEGGGLGEGGRWPLLAACMEGVLEEGRSLRWPRNDKRNLFNGNGSWGGRGLGYPENMKEGPF